MVEHEPGEFHGFLKKALGRKTGVGGLAGGIAFPVRQHGIVFGMRLALLGMFGQVTLPVMEDAILLVGADA